MSTAKMPLELKPCTVSDYPRVVAVEAAAWADNPFNKILFPGPFSDETAELRAHEIAKQVEEDPATMWLKVVDTESIDPELGVAFAKWQIFKDKSPGPRPARTFGQGCNVEACEKLFGELGELREKYVADRNCLCKSPTIVYAGALQPIRLWPAVAAADSNFN